MTAQQLKNSILQMAVQGKLVPQNPDDEPASVLLERIKAEKEELIKQKKIKKEKPSAPITEDEIPFEIPDSWEWVRLGSILQIESGKALTSKAMVQGDIPVYGGNGITGYHNTSLVEKETVVIGRVGFYCGSVHITEEKAWITDNAFITTYPEKCINRAFLVYILRQMNLGRNNNATAQPVVSGKKIYPLLFPLPPLNEQQRIVSKIEELLPYIEAYEKAETQLTALNTSFPDMLKKSILQEAVQGKLVPQNPDDEPASVLLERIRVEKQELIRQGKIKKEKPSAPITEEEIPFEIPESWCWTRISSIGTIIRGNGIKRTETVDNGRPCVRYGELYTTYDTKFSNTVSFVTDELFDKCKKISTGDVLFTLTGENKPDIAKTVTYIGHEEVAVGGDLAFWTHHGMNPFYLTYFMSSPYAINGKVELATGDIIVHISGEKIGSILIPVPPLSEQKRIVEKIEELMPMIESLS